MAAVTIGYVTYDFALPADDILFTQWPDALDMDQALVDDMLWAGFDQIESLAPPALRTEDPLTEATSRKLYRAQVLLARSALARARPAEGTGAGGDEYQLADLSRRLYLEARTILRPRTFRGIR